jgi:hypothetical protein
MSQDFVPLQITPRELEIITGKDVSDGFVGGVWGGVYRPSALRRLSGRLALMAIELVTAGLVFVFSLPIGLALIRTSSAGGSRVLIISAVMMALVMVAWNLYMRFQGHRLKRLLVLIDEVDHYNEMIAALSLFSKFGEDAKADQRQSLGTALELTRENLVAALVTERLLRENQRLLDRQAAFLSHLETNLVMLKTLEMDQRMNQQAQEYRRVLDEALVINLTVQREMEQLQKPRSS